MLKWSILGLPALGPYKQNIQEKDLCSLVHAGHPESFLIHAVLGGPLVLSKGSWALFHFRDLVFIFPESPHHPHQKSYDLPRDLPGNRVLAFTTLRN